MNLILLGDSGDSAIMIRLWSSDFQVQMLELKNGENMEILSYSLPGLTSLAIVRKDALGQLDIKFMFFVTIKVKL